MVNSMIDKKSYIGKYNDLASKYACLDDFSSDGPHYHRTKFYLDYIKQGYNVLDCGCSNGGLIKYLEENVGCKVFAFDIAQLNCARARENVPYADVLCGDIERIPFKSEYFDVVIAGEIIEHVLDVEEAVKECFRVLKEGGYFLFTVPPRDDRAENPEHINYLDKQSLKRLIPNVSITDNQYSLLCSSKKEYEQPLISLVMIVKDEEEILEKCLNSVKNIVDEFVIVDTGSTDNTKDIISKYGTVHERPFTNFVESKNEALKLATGKYVLWMDADEILYQGHDVLREYAEEGKYNAVYGVITEGPLDDYSKIAQSYFRARLWKRGEFSFVGPGVHEVATGPEPTNRDYRVLVRHEHLKSNKRETAESRFLRYVDILKEAIANNNDVIRAWFYLGRTYKDLNQTLNAISAYKEYLDFPNNTYKDEIWQAHYDIACCYKSQGEYVQAVEWLNEAKAVDERRSEVDCLLGDIAMQQQNYIVAAKHYENAIRPLPRDVVLFMNPQMYKNYPMDQLVLCKYYQKDFSQSLEIVKSLVNETNGRDSRILNNMWWCYKEACPTVFMTLGRTPEPIYGGMLNDVGVGGVETTYIELSSELVKLGMNVFLFGNMNESHVYNGVYYVPFSELDEYISLNPDVVITSRWFEPFRKIKDAIKIIWFQDAFFGVPNDFPDLFTVADGVVCSSSWHSNYIMERLGRRLSVDKLSVVPLGIRKSLFFNQKVDRKSNRIIYSSNPDRGLEHLIDMWDEIVESCPNVELVVTYGWEGLKTWSDNQSWHNGIDRLQHKCFKKAEEYGNIRFTGRITKNVLAKEMLSSSILAYPNNFWETFCLTALEAQAAGLCIITTKMGALPTVINNDSYNVLIEGSPTSEYYQKEFIKELKHFYHDNELMNNCSNINKQYIESTSCDWSDICFMWRQLIYNHMKV
jgi:SAM-dependent methyltransferase/glycosyltransferase involved in cell wall biosynthesis